MLLGIISVDLFGRSLHSGLSMSRSSQDLQRNEGHADLRTDQWIVILQQFQLTQGQLLQRGIRRNRIRFGNRSIDLSRGTGDEFVRLSLGCLVADGVAEDRRTARRFHRIGRWTWHHFHRPEILFVILTVQTQGRRIDHQWRRSFLSRLSDANIQWEGTLSSLFVRGFEERGGQLLTAFERILGHRFFLRRTVEHATGIRSRFGEITRSRTRTLRRDQRSRMITSKSCSNTEKKQIVSHEKVRGQKRNYLVALKYFSHFLIQM